jgi:hypothetical protein
VATTAPCTHRPLERLESEQVRRGLKGVVRLGGHYAVSSRESGRLCDKGLGSCPGRDDEHVNHLENCPTVLSEEAMNERFA